MTDPRDHTPHHEGGDDRLDARLSELLSDAVSDVEPGNALHSIRNRTKVTPMSARRPWLFAAGGAVVATAAVLTAIAFAGGNLTGASDDDTDPADRTSQSPDRGKDETDSPSPSPSETDSPGAAQVVPVYFVGDTPSGLRLYREFQEVTTSDAPTAAVELAVTGSAQDPDYSTTWPGGTGVAGVSYDGDVITVDLTGAPRTRPSGVSEEQASMAVEQVIYTAQAAVQQGRPGVQVLVDGERTDQVLGVPVSEPLANGPVLQTLALVSLTSPAEGEVVSGGSLEVSGVANSFEANVVVRVQRYQGNEVVLTEPITAEGWMGEQLFPFEGTLDLSDLEPGEYLLSASTDDPSGGTEGSGPHTDTRLIIVE